MTLTINLPDEQEAALKARAEAQGVSAEQCARQLLQQALLPEGSKSLSARIRDIWADMPDNVRSRLPSDAASQHDHYIYGLPRKEQ